MTKHIGYRKPGVFVRFILSYMVILVIPLFLTGIFIFNHFVRSLSGEIQNSTLTKLSQTMDVIDVRLQELNNIGVQLPQNQNLVPMIYAQNVNNLSEYQFFTFVRELRNYRAANVFIDNIFFYFRNSDVIIGANGKYSMPIFFDQVYRYEHMFISDFKHMLNTVQETTVRPVEAAYNGSTRLELITYLMPMPVTDLTYKSTLMITMDASSINKIAANILGNYRGRVYVLDEKKRLITTVANGDISIEQDVMDTLLRSSDPSVYEKDIEGRQHMLFYMKSPKTGWSYVAVMPSDQILAKVNNMRDWAFLIILLSMVIGVSAAYYFSYGNYYPIKKMVEMLPGYSREGQGGKQLYQNELDVLNTVLANTITQNATLEQRLKEQMPVIQTDFLVRLLKGNFVSVEAAGKMADLLGIDLHNGPFAVIIFSINDIDELSDQDAIPTQGLYRFSISNVVGELSQSIGKAYTVDVADDQVAVIVDFQGKTENALDEIVSLGEKTRDFFEKNFDFTLTVGIGRVYPSMVDIFKSYVEARSAIDYKMVKGKNTVIVFEQISTDNDERYYYSLQNERRILEALKLGDFDGVSQVLGDTIRNIKNRPIPLNIARCIYFEIINTAMKALAELGPEDYSEVMRQGSILPDLLKCETLDEVYEQTLAFYRGICERIQATKKRKNAGFENDVLDYVKNHYTDNNLSLFFLADKFSVTTVYLSRFFKSHTQLNFVDYLHQLRLKKAKELLKTTGKSIADIASESGYTDSHSLIRAFKRYEGMTPGKFRELEK